MGDYECILESYSAEIKFLPLPSSEYSWTGYLTYLKSTFPICSSGIRMPVAQGYLGFKEVMYIYNLAQYLTVNV